VSDRDAAADSAPTMIAFERVSFAYADGPPIVSGLDLAIPRGQIVGVIGPNGAGKSTLVRLVLGLRKPTAGRVLLGAERRDVATLPRREAARLVAAVTQEEALEFPFTVREVVLLGRTARLGPLGFESAVDRTTAERAMEETGVAHLADRLLYTLSGGERKRVFLARALAQEPELLVLDEPAAALDIHHQIAIFDLLRARHERGVTVLVVVHDLNLAAQYCERLLLVRAGAPVVDGTVEEILTYRRVREAFDIEVYVGVNEVNGTRFLIPMSSAVTRR
jgi:iron complex transport system ATP-binding protein